MRSYIVSLLLLLFTGFSMLATESEPLIVTIASGLQNPRGVAVLPDGRLIVGEAGTGFIGEDVSDNTGRISVFDDLNDDGDFDDAGERTPVLENLPGYNILYQFQPGRDEIVGVGDVLTLEDGRIFFTLDDNFDILSIVELSPTYERVGNFFVSLSTINAITYNPSNSTIYAALSSSNAVTAITLDGEDEVISRFSLLSHQQQAVPAGIALDPLTGDLLVALFSGQLWDYHGSILSFMPGDAKIVRIDPQTGDTQDEITGLTTAVDVAVDNAGNLYVVEMTTEWPTPTMDTGFDLYADDAPPDAGGYARKTGRVTMYLADSLEPVILMEDIDTPTNITYHDGRLYISTGQGTPGRPVWVDGELQRIDGQILMLTLPQ